MSGEASADPSGAGRITVRALGPDDWAVYREVRLAALAADPDSFFRSVDEEAAYDESVWRSRLGSSNARTWVAWCASDPVATVTVLLGRPDAEAAELVGLWVAPAARGRGLGHRLIGEGLRWAQAHGLARLTLWVADDNVRVRGLYDSVGFAPTGATGAFPPPREHRTEHEESLTLAEHRAAPLLRDHEGAPPS